MDPQKSKKNPENQKGSISLLLQKAAYIQFSAKSRTSEGKCGSEAKVQK